MSFKFEKKVWLSSPTMHGDEIKFVQEAYETNWMSTVGANINELERLVAEKVGCKYAVALSCGTAALHLCTRLAGERLYGRAKPEQGSLMGHKVFCSDMTFAATLNSVAYENGEAVFIDTERDTWNMDPASLELAFQQFPDVKLVVVAHLYGVPGKCDEIRKICDAHGALLVEDAAESFGATYKGVQTGMFGDYAAISFNGNKIITGSSGGMFLTNSKEDADHVRKWSTQSREAASWYQHEEIGYNYRMSNVIAGVARGQMPYLEEHIAQKRAIYMRYKEGFKGLPVEMNPYDEANSEPNFWLSCLLIKPEAMCRQVRSETEVSYVHEPGKTCPTEILEKIAEMNAEGRPIWKPMHMQPMYKNHAFVSASAAVIASSSQNVIASSSQKVIASSSQKVIASSSQNVIASSSQNVIASSSQNVIASSSQNVIASEAKQSIADVGADIFARGLCLPSDNKMTPEQQDAIIATIKECFS